MTASQLSKFLSRPRRLCRSCPRYWLYCLLLLLFPALSAWPAGKQLTGPYAPASGPALAPAEAQKRFVVPDGFEVRLFAAEPDVINPVAMTWDARGRLWVLELYEYPLGAPPGAKPRDRIKILEDTDNDGRADKVTIFADGLNLATGLLLGNGGVYVGQAPDLLFLQDTNHDDVADTRVKLLTGFGLDDRHELLNGFAWGPDGWLYMTHGVFTHSKVKIPEASEPGVEVNAALARFDPATKRFEVFADGTSNPWGLDFDAAGNAFVSACVIDHLFHLAPGGIYVRQGGVPSNPYAYELLPSIVDHKHYMAAYCGICVYQGSQFPESYRGQVFMGNIHQNAINHDRLVPSGSSFKALAEKDFLTTDDGWFRPTSEQVGPDGALWIADWYDKYPCYQNAQADPEGVDRERGRIWRVVYTGKSSRTAAGSASAETNIGSRPDPKMDLEKMSDDDLVRLLSNPNIWQKRMAQRLLSERLRQPSAAVPASLLALASNPADASARLHALWTLEAYHGRAGALQPLAAARNGGAAQFPAYFYNDPDPAVRAWTARFIAERELDSDTAIDALKALASDANSTVRLEVAAACRRLGGNLPTLDTGGAEPKIAQVLARLILSSAGDNDPLLAFLTWTAAEPLFAASPERGLDWLAEHGADAKPMSAALVRKSMRRICDSQQAAGIDLTVGFIGRLLESDKSLVLAALEGLIEGQRARPVLPTISIDKAIAALDAVGDPQISRRARELGTLWGHPASVQATLAEINDPWASVDVRAGAIEAAKSIKSDAAREALLKLIRGNNPQSLIAASLRAIGSIGGDSVAGDLLGGWPAYPATTRATAADVLVSRRPWAVALLAAIESKSVAASDLPISAIRSLADSRDDFIRTRVGQVIGRVRPANSDKQRIIADKKKMILAGSAPDLTAGHELARKTCFVCHKLNGEGAEVGPDLTGSGRSSLDALLANVIDPNQVVGKGYENVLVETRDGRSVSGRLIEDSAARIRLLSSGPKEEIVAKADIAQMQVSELSVMPEGLEQMPDADFRNLILFILQAPQAPGAAAPAGR
jgi:putative membrane-bound dehydrogenase-like protein